jgi:hypothetical protein
MGLFSKKDKGPVMENVIWMNSAAKYRGGANLVDMTPGAIVIAWFQETRDNFDKYLHEQGISKEIRMANTVTSTMVENETAIFLEHYPLYSKEKDFIANWKTTKIMVLNSLDEPIFRIFNSENIVNLMKRMGLDESDKIKHPMIDSSVVRAQQKLEEKVLVDHSAHSAEEWFKRAVVQQ